MEFFDEFLRNSLNCTEQEVNDMTSLDIYTDGSCFGNPGIGGWGVHIPNITNGDFFGGTDKKTTNNEMELVAIQEALRFLSTFDDLYTYNKVNIYTDSMYVKNSLTDWIIKWEQNNWKTNSNKDVKHKTIFSNILLLKKKLSLVNINFVWIKSHNCNIHNERADELAKMHAKNTSHNFLKNN